MVPVPILSRKAYSSRLLYALVNIVSYYVPHLFHRDSHRGSSLHARTASGTFNKHSVRDIVFAVLIPVLVLLSGLFAGLTLGYMSLDETQLNVLSVSGTLNQRMYANKIMPIRKNGHLLLVTLLLANMIVNETLPVISDPVLGGGFQSVVVSTVLIVIFAEIIPQSLFTRHGLYLGAKMAGFTKLLIYALAIVAWPVAKLLEFVLGSHHGIIYRRAELKELIAMHSAHAAHGGDLKMDTVTIIGATLDLQEKVVKQAMTPIDDVFMLSIDSRLDYDLLKKLCETGHSRVPVYEEIDMPVYTTSDNAAEGSERTRRVKRILGIFLVKNCLMLDPKDATPLRKIPLNKVPFVPNNEPLLHILDKFQEGRSHMAIVSRFSMEKAASVKQAVKRGLTQRLLGKVGIGDSDDSPTELSSDDSIGTGPEGIQLRPKYRFRRKKRSKTKAAEDTSSEDRDATFDEATVLESGGTTIPENAKQETESETPTKAEQTGNLVKKRAALTRPLKTMPGIGVMTMPQLEQHMPADAVLSKEGAANFMKNFDPAVAPLGIITLEDVLEELIGEEIYDEFDPQGARGDPYEVPHFQVNAKRLEEQSDAVVVDPARGLIDSQAQTPSQGVDAPVPVTSGRVAFAGLQIPKPLKAFDIFALRSLSAPPTPRDRADAEKPFADGHVRLEAVTPGQTIANGSSNGTLSIKGRMQSGSPSEGVVESEENEQDREEAVLVAEDSAMNPQSIGESAKNKPSSFTVLGAPGAQINPPKPLGINPSAVGAVLPSSRSSSPAPTLEAILLDRKRRLQVQGSTSGGATAGSSGGADTHLLVSPATRFPGSVTPSTLIPVPGAGGIGRTVPTLSIKAKGKRFKSSPLGPIEGTGEQATTVAATSEPDNGLGNET